MFNGNVDDRTAIEILNDSDIVDNIILKMKEQYLEAISNSGEHENKLRETLYTKIRMLSDVRTEFQKLINQIGELE